MRKNNAFVAKIVNTRLTKIFMAIFAPDERLPSSATLFDAFFVDQNLVIECLWCLPVGRRSHCRKGRLQRNATKAPLCHQHDAMLSVAELRDSICKRVGWKERHSAVLRARCSFCSFQSRFFRLRGVSWAAGLHRGAQVHLIYISADKDILLNFI